MSEKIMGMYDETYLNQLCINQSYKCKNNTPIAETMVVTLRLTQPSFPPIQFSCKPAGIVALPNLICP